MTLLFAVGCAQDPAALSTTGAGASALVSADAGTAPLGDTVTFTFDFSTGTEGWVADFADYRVGSEDLMELGADHRVLPFPLLGAGYRITGTNRSDDLFMYLYRRVDGLEPKTAYVVEGYVDFATSAGSNCPGPGGSPGESVTVKIGATDHQPARTIDEIDHYRVDVDKGNQVTGGTEMAAVGHVGNGTDDCTNSTWRMKSVGALYTTTVTTDANGSAWLMFGTDSGYESTTTLYYTAALFRLYRQP